MFWQKHPVAALTFATFFLTSCGDDSKTADNSVNGTDEGIVTITDKTISGVSQKGPFVNGSSVTVQELEGETLAQTGGSFEGKIKNDMGEFSVKVKQLVSQHALLKANGFYRNEVTGDKSKSQITLYALTDLSNRDEVNVNLLTHLAYERTLYLATEEGLSVTEAKKQAESEVLKSFGIEGDFAAAEDLNIFGESDQNAALLAISILMQGDLSEGDFSERLANYAADIEQDGVWDDSKTATKIADWANALGLGSGLAKIRENITKWELSADVPMFEKYVNNFWWQNYGLGTCDKKREGEVLKNQNATSALANEYYICKSGAWQVASDLEKDTFGWTDSTDGAIKKGNATNSMYVFDKNSWRAASVVEGTLGGCIEARADSIGKIESVYYICKSGKWQEASALEYDTYKQACTEFGQIIHGNGNKDYAYFCYENEWRRFYGNESLTYGKLEDERDGQIYRTIKIGKQTWMAENLNYKIDRSYCASGKCDVYGRLYDWNQAQVVCPKNYHLPSSEEYDSLFVYIGGKKTVPEHWECQETYGVYNGIGEHFKAKTSLWTPLYDLTEMDKYGFSALPAGYYYPDAQGFDLEHQAAGFWTSSGNLCEQPAGVQIYTDSRNTIYENQQISIVGNFKSSGLSVRCIKDEE